MNRRMFLGLGSLVALVAALFIVATPSRGLADPVTGGGGGDPGIDTGGAIAGLVVNADERPVPGAHVMLITANGRPVARTMTNREGRFHFRPVRPGDYLVRAGKMGVGHGQAEATVVEGEVTRVRIVLRRR